jgi:hypothetical protein
MTTSTNSALQSKSTTRNPRPSTHCLCDVLPKPTCLYCSRPLIQFKEGDWAARRYHKACNEKRNLALFFEDYRQDIENKNNQ